MQQHGGVSEVGSSNGAAPQSSVARSLDTGNSVWHRVVAVVFWGVLVVVVGNDLIRFWRVGDPPLENPADFFPLGSAGAVVIGVLGLLGVVAAARLRRTSRLHWLLLAGVGLMLGGVVLAAALPVPAQVPVEYQPFLGWRSLALTVGLVGMAAAAAQWPGRYLHRQLFVVTVAVVWLGFGMTALKWIREDPVTLVAVPDTPSIFPVMGLMWNPNIMALVLVPALVVQLAWLRSVAIGHGAPRSGFESADAGGGNRHTTEVDGSGAPTRWLWWVGPVATCVLLVASLSRAGIIAGAVALGVMLIPARGLGARLTPVGRMLLLGAVVIVVSLVPLLVAAADGPDLNKRALVWQRSWSAIAERPLWGWGADNSGSQHAHNQVLETWQSGGVIALIGLALVVAAAVIAAVLFVSADSRLALGLTVVTAVQAGVEVFTPWRKFPSLPLALIVVVLALVASVSLGRDAGSAAASNAGAQ